MEHTNVSGSPVPARVRSLRLSWFLVVLLPFLVLVTHQWAFHPPIENDDYGQYLMHAQALAQGRPYADIGYIYTPYAPRIGPALEPPGWPLTLAPILATFGAHVAILKVLMLALAMAFALLAGRYFARHDDRWLGAGAALMCLLAMQQVHAVASFDSDLGFATLLWLVILLADEPGAWTWPRITAITVAGTFVLLYRTIGIVLIASFAVFALAQRREHRIRTLAPLGVWALVGWFVYLQLEMGVDVAASTALARSGNAIHLAAPEHAWHLIVKALHKAIAYGRSTFHAHLYPVYGDPWAMRYHVASMALMLLGFAACIRQRYRTFLAIFALCYFGVLLGSTAMADRYLWPLYPLLAYGMLNGLKVLTGWILPQRLRPRSSHVALTAAVALGLLTMVNEYGYKAPHTLRTNADAVELFRNLERLNQQASIRVAFVKPRVLAWHTGVPAMGIFAAPEGQILAELHRLRISHVVLGTLGMKRKAGAAFASLVEHHPGRFTKEFSNGSFQVFRLVNPDANSRGGS